MKRFGCPLFLSLMFFSTSTLGQPQAGNWYNFEGKLGNSEMQLSFYLFKTGEIKGNYILKYVGDKIQLSGVKKGNDFELDEIIIGQPTRLFKGKFTGDSMSGHWQDMPPRPILSFSARMAFSSTGTFEHRYTGLFGSAVNVENFVRDAKAAIMANNKNWIANHTSYPLKHLSGKGFNGIPNKQQMIQHFDQIFSPAFKEKIKNAYTTNLFVRNGSVMLGGGEVWIANTPASTKDIYEYSIIAINP